MNEMYKASLNGKDEISINHTNDNTYSIEGNEYQIEKFDSEIGLVTIRNGLSSYNIKIQKIDNQNKSFQLRLKGTKHTVQIKDKFDLLLDELGFDSRSSASLNQLKAPMPGLILEVNVSEGTLVNKGDKLLVLEAMKMENVLKSPGEGIVKEIRVVKGESVEKNQVLIQF